MATASHRPLSGNQKMTRVLVCCEFSGTVREAFASVGCDAWSNDIIPGTGNHINGDCFDAIDSRDWDIIIMHPPCTALAVSGNRWYGEGKTLHAKRLESIDWTLKLWHHAIASGARCAMENPVGCLPVSPDQYVQPWQFGHGETKNTALWLWWLPPLRPTNIVPGREPRIHKMPPSPDRGRLRSITYPGIANAMAHQWAPQPKVKT